jgi:hypothetical protein
MTYDIPGGYDKGPVSELQWKILICVCKNNNIDFKRICRETGKKRTTIIQSIEPMIKARLIIKSKVDPLLIKSRVIFRPTYKGKCYAESYGMKAEEIFSTDKDKDVVRYLQIVGRLSDASQRRVMMRELASNMLDLSIIDKRGNIKTQDKILALKDAFIDALTSLIQESEYDARSFLNDETTQWFSKYFSFDEIIELKRKLLRIKNNADSTLRILSRL